MKQTVVPIRKRAKKPFTLPTPPLVSGLLLLVSLIGRTMEAFASGTKKQKLRQLRLHMDTVRRESKVMLQKVDASNGQDSMEIVDEFIARHGDDEMRRNQRDSMAGVQAIRQEGESLKRIVQEAGEDKTRAAQEIEEYIEKHTGSALAQGYLASVLCQAGRYDQSLATYQKAAELCELKGRPGTTYRLNMGSVLQEKGDIDAAVAEFCRLTETIAPEEGGMLGLAYLQLGNALEANGDLTNARIAWKEAIRWDEFKVIRKTAKEKLQAPAG